MKALFRSLPIAIVCSISLYSTLAQATHPEIYESMSHYLTQKHKIFLERLVDQYDDELEKMRSGKQNLLRSEIERAQQELREEQEQKNVQLQAKKKLIKEQLAKYNADVDLLKKKADEHKQKASSSQFLTMEVARLNRELQNLAEHLQNEVKPYIDHSKEADKITAEHKKLVDDIQSGRHPTVIEIEEVQSNFNAYAKRKSDEIEEQLQTYNRKVYQFQQWLSMGQNTVIAMQDYAKRLADDYNSYIEVVNQKIVNYNTIRNKFSRTVETGSFGAYLTGTRIEYIENDQTRKALQELESAKANLEQKRLNFEGQKIGIDREHARIVQEKPAKEEALTGHRNQVVAFQKQVDEELLRRKAELERHIQALQDSLEQEIKALTEKFDKLDDSMRDEYGPHFNEFIALYSEWAKEGKLKATDIMSQCGADLGERGGGMIQCMAQIDSLAQERLQYLTELSKKDFGGSDGMSRSEIETSDQELINRKKAIEVLSRELLVMTERFDQELSEKAHDVSAMDTVSKQKLTEAEHALRELFKQRAKIAELELNILAKVILAKGSRTTDFENHVCEYNQACSEFDIKAAGFKDYFEVDLLRKEMLFDYVRAEAQDVVDPNEEWTDYSHEKLLEKVEVTGVEKKVLIAKWYKVLRKKNVLLDCNPLFQICSTVSEVEFDQFKLALFQNSLFGESNIYRIKFDNGNQGFQVVLNGKTYWLGKNGDLKEFIIERPKADSKDSDESKEKQEENEKAKPTGKIFICKDPEQYIGHDPFGNGQCVTFVQQVTEAPLTKQWKPGERVRGNCNIEKGTAIASFDNEGIYPDRKTGQHAALYLCQDENGINVIDQYKGKGVTPNYIKFFRPTKPTPLAKKQTWLNIGGDGDYYHIIERK